MSSNHVDPTLIRAVAKHHVDGNQRIAIDFIALQESPQNMAIIAMQLLVAIEELRAPVDTNNPALTEEVPHGC